MLSVSGRSFVRVCPRPCLCVIFLIINQITFSLYSN